MFKKEESILKIYTENDDQIVYFKDETGMERKYFLKYSILIKNETYLVLTNKPFAKPGDLFFRHVTYNEDGEVLGSYISEDVFDQLYEICMAIEEKGPRAEGESYRYDDINGKNKISIGNPQKIKNNITFNPKRLYIHEGIGIVGTICMMLLYIFGTGQTGSDYLKAGGTAFWFPLIIGILFSIVLTGAAWYCSVKYNEKDVTLMTAGLSAGLLPLVFASPWSAVFYILWVLLIAGAVLEYFRQNEVIDRICEIVVLVNKMVGIISVGTVLALSVVALFA